MIEFIHSRSEAGRCVLFCTHVRSEAERRCDRIGVVFGGRMLDVGTLDELRQHTGAHWLEDVFKAIVLAAGEEFAEPLG